MSSAKSVAQLGPNLEELFENNNTLSIYVYMRTKKDSEGFKEVGIRELQKSLNFSSTSTVSWHLDKLEEAGLVEQNINNKYRLTDMGTSLKHLNIPLSVQFTIYRGVIIPKLVFLLAFLGFLSLISIVQWFFFHNPLIIGINGSLSLLITFGIVLYMTIKIYRTMKIQTSSTNSDT